MPIEVNLRSFIELLHRQGMVHRVIEESGEQVIYTDSEATAAWIREALAKWQQAGSPDISAQSSRSRTTVPTDVWLHSILRVVSSSPVTLSLTVLCLFVALLSGLGRETGRVDFLFYPLVSSRSLPALLADLNSPILILRSLTPMFLHFGELHLIFNLLWLWFFGKQIESIQPGWLFLLLILIMAFVSNTTQFMTVQFNNFGGMSGVVYGLVGYAWVIHNFMPRSLLMLNNSMFVFFIIALILMELLAGSWIATAAHVGGLASGLILGGAMVLVYRFLLKRPVVGKPDSGFL